MASQTVDSLLLQTQVDDSGLTAQFNKQIQEVNRLTDQVNRASAAIKPITITADLKGLSAAEQSVSQFFAGFKGAQVGNVVELLQAMNAELAKTGETDFTGKLITQLATIQGEFAATSTEAKELQAIIDTLGQSKLPTAAAGGGGGPPPPPPVDQFSAFRREAAATNATVSELTATMARGSAGALAYGEGMARTAVQQRVLATETEQTARRTAQFSEASRQASLGPFQQGLENVRLTGIGLRQELGAGTAAFERHGLGAGRAAQAVGFLAAQSVGATGPVARLAETALLFSGGEIALAAVAGGVLALGAAYNFLTTAQREAEEKQQKLRDGLLAEAETLSAAEKAARGLVAAREALARSREGLTAPQVAKAVIPAIQLVVAPTEAFAVESERRRAQASVNAAKEERQALGDIARAEGANLTQSLQLHIATGAQRERAIALVKILQSQEGALLATDEQKIANAKLLNDLTAGLADRALESARLAATTQGIQSEHALRQQAIQADEADLRAQFAIEAVIREASLQGELTARTEFFARLRALRVSAARDDESTAQQRITAIQGQAPTKDAAVQTARDAEVAGLRSQIQLREQILRAQLAQLRNEERLAQITPLERVGTPTPPQFLEQKLQLRTVGTDELRQALGVEVAAVIQDITDTAKQISFEQAVESADKAAIAAGRLDTAIHRIASEAGGLAGVVAGLLGIGGAASAAIGQVVGLVGSLGDVRKANADIQAARDAFNLAQSTGDVAGQAAAQGAESAASAEKVAGVLGAVTAGLGLVGNILSIGAALDAEHNRIVTENSQRLAELSLRLDRSFQGAGGVQKAAGITADVSSVVAKTLNADALGALRTQDAFEEALKASGLTLREFERIIKDTTGIEVLDSKGHILATTLGEADEAFKKVIETITQLPTDPASRRAQLETEDKLGIGGRSTDPKVAALQRERDVQLGGLQLGDKEEARIRALDLTTAKGRAEFLKFEQGLAERETTKGKELSAAELHDFHNAQELFQSLGIGADAVNAFTDSIHAVTDQTANIPRSFKQFQTASAAEIAGLGPNVPRQPETPRLRGTDVVIPLPPGVERGSDGASLPAFVAALKESTLTLKAVKEKPAVISGNTVTNTFNVQPTDIPEFARLVAIEMRKLGTADRSSNSDPWDG